MEFSFKKGIERWGKQLNGGKFTELSNSSHSSNNSSSQSVQSTPLLDTNNQLIQNKHSEKQACRLLEGHSATVLTMAIWRSESMNILITGSGDHTVKIWNLDTSEILHSLVGHCDWIRSVATSRDMDDHPIIVSASADKSLIVWELLRGEQIHHLIGHAMIVYAVAVSKDPKFPFIVSGSWDKTIKMWEIDSGDLLRTIEGHNAAVCCVAISSGILPVIISGGEDDVMKVRVDDICINSIFSMAIDVFVIISSFYMNIYSLYLFSRSCFNPLSFPIILL